MKLTSQMPSSTSLIPRHWPARHSVDDDFLAVQTDAAAGGDEDVTVMQRVGEVRQTVVRPR